MHAHILILVPEAQIDDLANTATMFVITVNPNSNHANSRLSIDNLVASRAVNSDRDLEEPFRLPNFLKLLTDKTRLNNTILGLSNLRASSDQRMCPHGEKVSLRRICMRLGNYGLYIR
ncbi:hypothetical protein BGX24_002043 [Mortierella sp. AD032]|nr:hypothetical protein BGX24_002043 [Mortierella sp. AD032]